MLGQLQRGLRHSGRKSLNSSARYLVRFDDICPTMNWRIWPAMEAALEEFNVRPLLAVVPDNRDPVLQVDPPRTDFWDCVRGWRRRGWTIAMHGYQHRYVTRARGLVGINNYSEFAGLPSEEQEEKIRRGREIFQKEGLEPRIFIAPAHSFDAATLAALLRQDFRVLSDGFTRYPYISPEGIFWIPQQLWDFTPKAKGVWTVCIHHNGWCEKDVAEFRGKLSRYGNQITFVEALVEEYGNRPLRCADRLHAWLFGKAKFRLKAILKRGG
jgi:predicted deacetylase